MLKLAFSEYHLISSACFNLPPDLKSNCWATQERSAGKTLEVLGVGGGGGGGGGGSNVENFRRGGATPRSNQSPFYIPFLTEMVPLSYTFQWQMVQLSHTYKV